MKSYEKALAKGLIKKESRTRKSQDGEGGYKSNVKGENKRRNTANIRLSTYEGDEKKEAKRRNRINEY